MTAKILAVDDEPDFELLIKLRFRQRIRKGDLTFRFARHGEEALAALAEEPDIGLLLLDINMPVMDGLTFIRELRKLPEYRGVPIIFLSTESDAGVKQQAKEAGATGWIVKPFQAEQLLGVVKKVLGS